MHRFRLALCAGYAAILATACAAVLAVPAARVCVLQPRSGWSTIDNLPEYDTWRQTGVYIAFAFPDGAIGVAGHGRDASGVMHWLVRRGTKDGSTWTFDPDNDDDFVYPPPPDERSRSQASTVGVVAAGNTYVGGHSKVSNRSHWIVRRLDAGKSTWVLDNEYSPEGATECEFNGITVTPAGSVLAVGACGNAEEQWRSIVRRRDAGGTWTDVHGEIEDTVWATGIWTLANGHVLVATEVWADDRVGELVLFESDNDGLTWRPVERYHHPNQKFTSHYSFTLAETAAGDLVMPFLLYEGEEPNVLGRWAVLRKAANSSEWILNDEYGFDSTGHVEPTRVFKDLAGNIYAAGGIRTAMDTDDRVVIRKSADGGLTWEPYDEFQLDNRPTGIGSPLMLPSGDIVIPLWYLDAGGSLRSSTMLSKCLPNAAPGP